MLINSSWLELKPNINMLGNPENFQIYYDRIRTNEDFKHIPKEVFEQWIHAHHSKPHTLKHYAWIDMKEIVFSIREYIYEEILQFYVIKECREWVETCSKIPLKYIPSNFMENWERNGTWEVPPVVLNVLDFKSNSPKWTELKNKIQLIEGHTRLGYLRSLFKAEANGKISLAKSHKFWVLSKKEI
jgi:hypothetical protein